MPERLIDHLLVSGIGSKGRRGRWTTGCGTWIVEWA
jgi:hypothetical protein